MQYITKSEQETIDIGYEIGKGLKPNDIVALYGDLGAGKTAFVRGVCLALGVDEISSPTFSLVNEYEGGRLPIFHFDAYRIDCEGWFDLGFDEYLYRDGVCVIEWAENIELPNCIKVYIEGSGDSERNIKYEHSCN